jgi:hypothetical protein
MLRRGPSAVVAFVLTQQRSPVPSFSHTTSSTVWAAKVPTVPVQMAVSSFGNQKGLIVCMDDSGMLTVNYLGERYHMESICVVSTICSSACQRVAR